MLNHRLGTLDYTPLRAPTLSHISSGSAAKSTPSCLAIDSSEGVGDGFGLAVASLAPSICCGESPGMPTSDIESRSDLVYTTVIQVQEILPTPSPTECSHGDLCATISSKVVQAIVAKQVHAVVCVCCVSSQARA